jgi:hypothetical protein
MQHAPKDFGRLQRQVNQFDAVGLDCAIAKSLRAVERSTGECEAQSGPWVRVSLYGYPNS